MKRYSNQKNADIFKDTQNRINKNENLKKAVLYSVSNQKYIPESAEIIADVNRFTKTSEIIVSSDRSFEAANKYVKGTNKICVLNFASAFTPGGGVENGYSAQEESLCRISTLRNALIDKNVFDQFYNKNRTLIQNSMMGGEYCGDCIYTPEVVVFKKDTKECELLSESQWYKVDVLTCAAPDLRIRPDRKNFTPTDYELAELHEKRAKKILDIAVSQKVDVLILGAFGCGVFKNPPEVVAKAYANVIRNYRYAFKTIEFAVYCSPNNKTNFEVFNMVLGMSRSDKKEVIGFHNPDEENGYLSNWYLSDFECNGEIFTSMEQYMMYMKAIEFSDMETASEILCTSYVSEIKALGRKVKNYNDTIWNGKRQILIFEGLFEKFRQNRELSRKLISTEDSVLAECAVNDRIWGIGLSMDDERRFDIDQWNGQNLLGFSLMIIRDRLKK